VSRPASPPWRGSSSTPACRPALHIVIAATLLALLALLRFRDSVRWDLAGTVMVGVLVALLATVALALATGRPSRR
jgi:hypothetical protein